MKLKYDLTWFIFLISNASFYRLCFRIAPSVHPDHVPYFMLYALIALSILLIPATIFFDYSCGIIEKSGRKFIIDLSGESGIYLRGMMFSALAMSISAFGLVWTLLSGETFRQIFFSSGSFLGLVAVRIRIILLLRELIRDKR